ncbi:hypothetical protein CHS0354_012528 [Potamilus streckersoni]|uniref:Uncharacterized protein n=1 Tax=Potamilus streckersoni TaxID=2493646 RepID=A0AAE0SW70_9BIVA|nr:hypothetical protein CHS0354_012528 [Potamilus streckersoni]
MEQRKFTSALPEHRNQGRMQGKEKEPDFSQPRNKKTIGLQQHCRKEMYTIVTQQWEAKTHPLQSQGRSPGTPTKRCTRATAPEEGKELIHGEFFDALPDWCFVALSSAGRVLSMGDVGDHSWMPGRGKGKENTNDGRSGTSWITRYENDGEATNTSRTGRQEIGNTNKVTILKY